MTVQMTSFYTKCVCIASAASRAKAAASCDIFFSGFSYIVVGLIPIELLLTASVVLL